MNLRPLGRNPQRVLHQVVDDLPKSHRIHVHVDGPRCFRERQGDTIAIASSAPHLCCVGEDLPHIDVGCIDMKVSGTQSSEVEKVVDKRTKGGALEYKVQWKVFDRTHDSWEPAAGLSAATAAPWR